MRAHDRPGGYGGRHRHCSPPPGLFPFTREEAFEAFVVRPALSKFRIRRPLTRPGLPPVRKRYQSSPLARRGGVGQRGEHGKKNRLRFITTVNSLYYVSFCFCTRLILGFRPTNQTTQYDDSSRSRHVTVGDTHIHLLESLYVPCDSVTTNTKSQ
jgi:hypothetical protein